MRYDIALNVIGVKFQSPFEEKVVSIMLTSDCEDCEFYVFQSPFEEKVVSIGCSR